MGEQMPLVRSGMDSAKDGSTFIPLSPPHMGDQELNFVHEAFRTNWLAPAGPNVDNFEKEMAEYLGVGGAAALCSGTAALHLALEIIGVRQKDIVLCSSNTFIASAQPILYQKAIPVFIDSEPDTWNMSPAALKRAFTQLSKQKKRVKAVIVVNTFGLSSDFAQIRDVCNQFSTLIIEDAAESLGGEYRGRKSGTFGDLAVLSFNGNKIITTTGGGMLVSNNLDWIKRAKFLSTQAKEDTIADPAPYYSHSTMGFNYRLSNVLAGIGRGQLQVLPARVERRREVFRKYQQGLRSVAEIEWMPEPEGFVHTRWLTSCLLPKSLPRYRIQIDEEPHSSQLSDTDWDSDESEVFEAEQQSDADPEERERSDGEESSDVEII